MNRRLPIVVKGRQIGDGAPIFLTAEIGCSHMGKLQDAKTMMKAARDAGCDGADMFIANGPDFYWGSSGIEKHALGAKNSIQEWQRLSFTPEQWEELFAYADEIGLILYLTPLDPPSIEVARRVKSPMINLNSDDLNNPILLRLAATLRVPVTLHDINANLAEVEGAVRLLRENGCPGIILLHSTMESGNEDVLYATANLRVMDTYRAAFGAQGVRVGCVEHTTSHFLIYAVAALRPVLISKHLIYRHKEGVPDNRISLEADEMKDIVANVRHVERAMGMGSNVVSCGPDGQPPKYGFRRKVVVAARDIPKGRKITLEDLAVKRPGDRGGLHPGYVDLLAGATARADIATDTVLDLNQFEQFAEPPYKPYQLERRVYVGKAVGP